MQFYALVAHLGRQPAINILVCLEWLSPSSRLIKMPLLNKMETFEEWLGSSLPFCSSRYNRDFAAYLPYSNADTLWQSCVSYDQFHFSAVTRSQL